jgi:hypothetical protein
MSKYAQGIFTPKNPQKYIGKGSIKYRSSWELAFMHMCDQNPGIKSWASESIRIPYRNPFTGKNTIYVPDFFIVYEDKSGNEHKELVEIKPSKEITLESAKSQRDKLAVTLNHAKWAAAFDWCQRANIKFRIVSENEIFHQGKKK